MSSTTTILLVASLTILCLALLATTGLMIWWMTDSAGQHSISAGKQQRLALEAMRETMAQSSAVATAQMHLTELLLLGRPMPATVPELVSGSEPETPLTPDDLWTRLPGNMREAMLRDIEEEGTWPSPSETLQPDSEVVLEQP